jgi:hypothetical protein
MDRFSRVSIVQIDTQWPITISKCYNFLETTPQPVDSYTEPLVVQPGTRVMIGFRIFSNPNSGVILCAGGGHDITIRRQELINNYKFVVKMNEQNHLKITKAKKIPPGLLRLR